MLPLTSNFLSSALAIPHDVLPYELGRRLGGMRPGRYVLESDSGAFDLAEALADGVVRGGLVAEIHSQISARYIEAASKLDQVLENAVFSVVHGGDEHEVVVVSYRAGDSFERRSFIVSPSRASAEALFSRVCRHCSEVSGEVLVFDGGDWVKDERLFNAIRTVSMDGLVLRGSLRDDIARDLRTFFGSRATYERYRVPYKRGVLLYGPPGNGKTHFLKALIASLDVPCLYVKSLKGRYDGQHDAIRRVFSRARAVAPCLLVFEDLESIVTDDNRSFFLNELDGFAENTGVVVLATSNYPEQIDPAIIDRPSRFDRKYLFDLPSGDERRTYLERWSQRLESEMQPTDGGLDYAAGATQGFSFAYLKELTLSATMAWIAEPVAGRMDGVLRSVLVTLKEQSQRGKSPGQSRGGRRMGLSPEA